VFGLNPITCYSHLELLTPAKTNPGIMISFPKYSRKKIQQNKTKQKQQLLCEKTNKTKQNKVRKERDECKELEREKLTRGELHGCCWHHLWHREEEKERWRRCCTSVCLSVWATKKNKMVSVFYSVLGFPTPKRIKP